MAAHPTPPHDDEIAKLQEIIREAEGRGKNEADTRHQIIDFILHDLLKWPRNRTKTEEYIRDGYADYVLKKHNGDDLLFIEAKREGYYFDLPISNDAMETNSHIKLSKLLTNQNIKAAIDQVRGYCFDTGCENACVTNGHEWIFFRTFEKGKKWQNLRAFVVRTPRFFTENYTKAFNAFSFSAITERSSLAELLSSNVSQDRAIYYPKDKINSYSYSISSNKLASTLRPIVGHYFGVIGDDDAEFMDRCYVAQRDYKHTSEGMRTLLQDSLTPYFQDYGVQQLDDTGKGGRLGGKITKNLKHGRKGEVLVLFGGKGSGKSTFIKRLLYHNPPPWLRAHAVIAIIDLLKIPEDKKVIRAHIWQSLVEKIDIDGVLASDRESILRLFNDRFDVARKQELFGLADSSETYNIKLNDLVARWKSDKVYCAKKLIEYWRNKGRGIVIVVDNTDQYTSPIQDYCFSSAQEISSSLDCMTIISMREERFFNSKIHGMLDAFQNSGFHISSPKPAEVFRRRLEYTIMLMSSDRRRRQKFGEIDPAISQASVTYLKILLAEFSNDRSPLSNFLSACAHGDIRLSLDLFRSFVLSGYTNVDEMIASGTWNFQIHQVIKPVMIPSRYFYDESYSNIPNIYQIRHNRNGSHFTALRILRKLSKAMDASNHAYVTLAELMSYFIETFGMHEDFIGNADLLLKHGFIESSNRIDMYADAVDSIKVTNYGLYMLKNLSANFTYLDLVCTDCGIYDETVNNYLCVAAKKEFGLFNRGERLDRVKVRIDRVEQFLKYLEQEEQREKDEFSLGMPLQEMFTHQMRVAFDLEKSRVIASAMRQQALPSSGRA